ncbi:YiiX/YebB-like N1pC/P60 family cysteine hydrolase [Virgibacillus sp. M23]|uniref:YiiX/YebB-like N1pC/P60 family cysteine hydrolase n=1 Tax=Virgibacillus sp. M23 TaxID=3079030 RepID=UPI002A91D945|nr:YiiX/YebB-like N1pC/P60 family cysteine hydrolase [Virgibacillus sp. M23]MDY7043705.1 YiiX/YebB-like N1pC/P60 family cysteine hydrolase [Virgibacillus sp. M23]
MKRGDVVFVQGKGMLSRLIRYFDGNGLYSHVAIAISDEKVIEANYDTKVAIRDFDKEKYSIIDVPKIGLSNQQRMNIYNEALKYIGKRYDYIQLLWYILRKAFRFGGRNRLNNPNNVICSELVFIVLNESGVFDDLCIKNINRGTDLTPNELYDLVKYIAKNQNKI